MDLLAASESIDITPSSSAFLAGYTDRRDPYNAIHSELELNALLIVAGSSRILLISADVLYWGPVLSDYARRIATQIWGEYVEVFLAASHTHFAPATDPTKPKLGQVSDSYISFVEGRIGSLLNRLHRSKLELASIKCGSIETSIGINRRLYWPWPRVGRKGVKGPGVKLAPNSAASTDNLLQMIRVVRSGGENLAILWRVGCHPVAFPDRQSVSSEFPGAIRREIRRIESRSLPVLFFQGFCGDIRPAILRPNSLREMIRSVFVGPRFHAVSKDAWGHWVGSIERNVRQLMGETLTDRDVQTVRVVSRNVPLSAMLEDSNSSQQIGIRLLSLGAGLSLLFVTAEAVSTYVESAKAISEEVWPIGYEGDVFGYLPTDQQVVEGGYESVDFLCLFGLDGKFRKDLKVVWESTILDIRKDVGCKG